MSKPSMGAALRASVDAQSQADEGRFKAKIENAERALQGLQAVPESSPPVRAERPKAVRDTFTMPPDEHATIGQLVDKATALGIRVNRSQIVRAGLRLLRKVDDAELRAVLGETAPMPTGRPGSNR